MMRQVVTSIQMETSQSLVVRPLSELEMARLASSRSPPWLRYSRHATINALENHAPVLVAWQACTLAERLARVRAAERSYLRECQDLLASIAGHVHQALELVGDSPTGKSHCNCICHK